MAVSGRISYHIFCLVCAIIISCFYSARLFFVCLCVHSCVCNTMCWQCHVKPSQPVVARRGSIVQVAVPY